MTMYLSLEPAKHEEAAICRANQRIPNVYRIAGIASAMEQFVDIIIHDIRMFAERAFWCLQK